jgi:choline dehydrogenase-like flavoprotein
MDAFDVAIVGAGSAGCALAGRLAARTDLRVALVEAGPDYGPRTRGKWPQDLLDAHHSPDSHDWGLEQSRARVVGGCSTHNECALVRALPGDYDRWEIPGWSDEDLAPVVNEMQRLLPARVCARDELAVWQRAFLDTALASGFLGAAPFAQNIVDGIRWNAAFTFLDPVRSRVEIVSDILADRLVIEGDRAVALIGYGSDGEHEIHADRFVLCGGVYGSPAILPRRADSRSATGSRSDASLTARGIDQEWPATIYRAGAAGALRPQQRDVLRALRRNMPHGRCGRRSRTSAGSQERFCGRRVCGADDSAREYEFYLFRDRVQGRRPHL